mmetsp:Transcript_16525/g.39310  ORF Transcript_16525/g.39310 Transcript_16525/m.39310 type:complete len:279 (-) Transcript_16525:708-1544(-)
MPSSPANTAASMSLALLPPAPDPSSPDPPRLSFFLSFWLDLPSTGDLDPSVSEAESAGRPFLCSARIFFRSMSSAGEEASVHAFSASWSCESIQFQQSTRSFISGIVFLFSSFSFSFSFSTPSMAVSPLVSEASMADLPPIATPLPLASRQAKMSLDTAYWTLRRATTRPLLCTTSRRSSDWPVALCRVRSSTLLAHQKCDLRLSNSPSRCSRLVSANAIFFFSCARRFSSSGSILAGMANGAPPGGGGPADDGDPTGTIRPSGRRWYRCCGLPPWPY